MRAWPSPHHDGSAVYTGPLPTQPGGTVRLRVHVPHTEDGRPGARRVRIRAPRDGEPRFTDLRSYPALGGSWWQGELALVNPRTSYRFLIEQPDGVSVWLTAEGLSTRDVSDRADFVVDTCPPPPDWVHDQIAYQIFPDRFARSRTSAPVPIPGWAVPCEWNDPVEPAGHLTGRQYFGGDLDGIIEHLDHLTTLGVTTLYLTPVFEGGSNHRYDAVSFDHIDPLLGGDAAYSRLIDAAHTRGMRILGDLTTNHTGVRHAWFNQAQQDPDSAEAHFYVFNEHPESYHCWLNHPSLPTLNYTSGKLRERMYEGADSVVAHWLNAGIDGWRIDVANMTGKQGATDLTREVAHGIRQTIAQTKPDAWLLAEHFFDASPDLVGESWHGIMDYAGGTFPLWRWLVSGAEGYEFGGYPYTPLSASAIVATMREVHARYPWSAVTSSTVHLDSHDLPRFRTVVGGGDHGGIDHGETDGGLARQRHLIGAAIQLTLPGVPALFAGDELGLTATTGEHARTPMPWDHPENWDAETLQAYRTLIALRHEYTALRQGSLRWISAGDDHLTFVREHPEGRILVHAVRPRPDGMPPRDGVVRIPHNLIGESTPRTLYGTPLVANASEHVWILPGEIGAHIWTCDGSNLAWKEDAGD